MWKRASIIAAILVGIATGLGLGLKSERVSRNVVERLALFAKSNFGLTLTVDRLDIDLFPLGAKLSGVVLKRPGESIPWIRLHEGVIRIQPWPSSVGALVIDELRLDGLDVDLRQIGEGLGDRADSTGKAPAIDVRNLGLYNVSATIPIGPDDLRVEGLQLALSPYNDGRRRLRLDLERAVGTLSGREVQAEAHVTATLEGSIDRPKRLTLDDARIFFRRIALDGSGTVDLDQLVPKLDLAFAARLDLENLQALAGLEVPLEGDTLVTTRLGGSALAPTIRVEMRSDNAKVAGRKLGRVAVDARYAKDHVVLESFEVVHERAGKLTGSGSVGLEEGYPVRATARAHGSELAEILDLAGLPGAWVRLPFGGDLRTTGRLDPFALELEADLLAQRFQVLGASHHLPEARVFLDVESIPIRGRAAITPDFAMLNGIEIDRPSGPLVVEGMLHYRDGLDLRASAENVSLAEFGPVADVPFGGRGAIAVAVEGPYTAPVVSGSAELNDFSTLGMQLGDAIATLIYSGTTLQLDRVRIRRGEGIVRGAGRLRFGDAVGLEAAFDLADVEFGSLLTDLAGQAALGSRIEARSRGRLIVGGTLENPDGIINIKSDLLKMDAVVLGPMGLEIGFSPGEDSVWGELSLRPEGAALDARVAVLRDGNLDIRADATQIPLPLLTPLIGSIPLAGTLSGRARLVGPAEKLSGSTTLRAKNFVAYGTQLEETTVRAQVKDGRADLVVAALDGALVGNGSIALGHRLPFTLTTSFVDLNLARLWPVDAVVPLATGSVFAQGDLTRGDGIMADVEVARSTITSDTLSLEASDPFRLTIADGALIVPGASFVGPGTRVRVSGKAPFDEKMAIDIVGHADLSKLAGLSSRIESGKGELRFRLALGGAFTNPLVLGSAELESGRLRLGGMSDPLEDIDAKITFSGASMSVDRAHARFGGGTVELNGQAVFGAAADSELSLRTTFEDVTLRPNGVRTVASGVLDLRGAFDDLMLTGDVRIDELRYTKSVDLASLIPRRSSSPLKVPAVEDSEVVGLAVRVRADDNLLISNNVLEAELRADMTLTGTSNRMGILGSVTPLWARARYAGNLFELQRGSVDFTEEYEVAARFDFRAVTEACGIDVTVDIFGTSQEYAVSPSGTDENGPVDPQDVLVCLQFGVRNRNIPAAGTANPAAARGTSDSGLAAAATGLDALWTVSGLDERVRNVLPIELDEVRLTSAWSPQAAALRPRLVLGKEIGEKLRLQYWQSVFDENPEEAYQALSIQYQLSQMATLEGTWLSETQADIPITDLGLDLRMRWELR